MIKESLRNLNISSLNQMQEKAIEAIYTHRNTFVHAPTGSGKTLAYLIPATQMVLSHESRVQVLIIVPTRELACQITDVHSAMKTPVKAMCCYGGHSLTVEKVEFTLSPSILIGTPGRIASHMREERFDFSAIKTLVLDEFDKSLEFGFQEEISFIIGNLKKLKKRICVSATRMSAIPEFAGMSDPCVVEFSDQDLQPHITLKTVLSPSPDKLDTLVKLIRYIGDESALIFCNFRDAVERVTSHLESLSIDVLKYHGGMEQQDREIALYKFRNGSHHLLVTTDLASRGLNIPEIKYIVHYHMPSTQASFIHRNGRTARMNATGTTFIILSENESPPDYLPSKPPEEVFSGDLPLPAKKDWVTLQIDVGKRDKISKTDIVGFLFKKGRLRKDELGLVEIMHRESFAAVKREKIQRLLRLVANETVKRKLVKVSISR